jgi:hypothetical protein
MDDDESNTYPYTNPLEFAYRTFDSYIQDFHSVIQETPEVMV